MLDHWVYQPGLPANVVTPDPAGLRRRSTRRSPPSPAAAPCHGRPRARWTTAERLRFLNKLPRKLPKPRLDAARSQRSASTTPATMEVLFAWLELAVANRYDPAVPSLERFLTTQGRRKFVRPLIKTLAKDKQWGRPIAARIYRQARPSYHPITQRDLDELNLGG